MTIREKIYNLCNRLGKGQSFSFLEYDRMIKKPTIIVDIFNNIDNINNLYKLLLHSNLKKIIRTPCGTIKKHNIHHAGGAWDVEEVYTDNNQLKGVIITVIINGEVFILKCGGFSANKKEISGTCAFRAFLSACKAHNINIEDYYTNEGSLEKTKIEKPYIAIFKRYNIIPNVNHIDLNSAWAAGVCVDYPEFYPVFKDLLLKDKLYPSIALGYCQSRYIGYRLAKLSQSGVNNCNRMVESLLQSLTIQDFEIIGVNTDGIWYRDKLNGDRIYHDSNEGVDIGQWKTDYKNVSFLAYSDGQYCFREANGTFNVRARGSYSYEKIKAREHWNEEDFDKAMGTQIIIEWDPEEGFICVKN